MDTSTPSGRIKRINQLEREAIERLERSGSEMAIIIGQSRFGLDLDRADGDSGEGPKDN